MPKLLDIMFGRRPIDFIGDQNDIRLLKFDAAAVREAGILALGFQQIALGISFPGFNADFGTSRPAERSCSDGLIASIHDDGIVRLRSTKRVAPFLVAYV